MRIPSVPFYPPLPPSAYVRRPSEQLPYPLGRLDCALFARGRHAIWQAVRALGLGPGDTVLAPAWHHGAEIEALRRAGPSVSFYEVGGRLEPEEQELESLIDQRTRALLLTHFLGFPQDGARWRQWCEERELLLIEDAAHACLACDEHGPAGSHGHAAIWCLFKSFALPDGAALRLEGSLPQADSAPGLGASDLARGHAHWLLQHAHGAAALANRPSVNGHFDLHAEIQLGDPDSPPSAATAFLLPRLADAAAAVRRRAHYELLLAELGEQVPEPFDKLPEHAAPLGFPLVCPNKRATLRRLAEHGIDAVDFWSVGHPILAPERFPLTARRRETTVLLPVQQELGPSELERTADAARARPRARPALTIEHVSCVADVRDDWSDLARRARNVFATPEWAAVWCAHFIDARALRLLALRDAPGRLVAVLPLYEFAERPLRVVRFVGHGPGENLGPVCDPRDRVRVARALPRVLAELGAQALLADHAPREHHLSGLTGARVLRTGSSPIARFGGCNFEEFMATRSRKLRKELRRQERLLRDRHGLRYHLGGSDPGRLADELESMFALHEARWGDAPSRFSARLAFHRDFATIACERGWLRLWTLEADGRAVASAYGFRYEGADYDYQGGRDPAWHEFSIGMVLLAQQMRSAIEDGMSEFRHGRGDQWYKRRLATHDPGLETFLLPRGPAATALATAGSALPEPISTIVKRRLAA